MSQGSESGRADEGVPSGRRGVVRHEGARKDARGARTTEDASAARLKPTARPLQASRTVRGVSRQRPRARRSVADEICETLLGGPPTLTMLDLAARAGTTIEMARKFWRGMGYANVPDDAATFTEADVRALRGWVELLAVDVIDEETMLSLLRAQSYNADRLALWQFEAAVESQIRLRDLDDTAARLAVMNQITRYAGFGVEQLEYTWRRRMASLAERIESETAQRLLEPLQGDVLPLPRALGFIDMVAFTSRARQLGSRGLAELVQGFEFTARDVIAANGARVVKTVGDAVLYIADDLMTAARVSLTMLEAIRANPVLLPVRGSLVWGRVVSRSGDIFGPAVNLASRLIDVAPKDTVYMDETTAAMLAKHPHAGDFVQIPQAEVDLQGIGRIRPIELRWAAPAAHNDLWIPTEAL